MDEERQTKKPKEERHSTGKATVQSVRATDEYKKIKKIKDTLERENRDLKKSVYELSYK